MADIAAIAISIVAIVISLITWYKSRPIETRQLQISTLSQILSILSSKEQQDARGIIFKVYCLNYPNGRNESENKEKMTFDDGSQNYETVRKILSAFDQVAVLVVKNLVDAEVFLDLYAGMTIRTYEALREHIDKEVEINDQYCRWFRQLNKLAEDYYTRKGETLPTIYCK